MHPVFSRADQMIKIGIMADGILSNEELCNDIRRKLGECVIRNLQFASSVGDKIYSIFLQLGKTVDQVESDFSVRQLVRDISSN